MSDLLSYKGKRVAIVGCFSGMGEACARTLVALGAEVHGADIKPSPVSLASFTQVDLKDWESINRAVDSIGGEIDALFNCAGLPQTFPPADVLSVNFLGIRHWTEQWLPRLRRDGAIATISSLGGMGFLRRIPLLTSLIAISDKQAFLDWVASHPEEVQDGYALSKELVNAWTCLLAQELGGRGIRVNATMPSPTQTPMMAAFENVVSKAVLELFTIPSGRRATPTEQGNPLVFLNSNAASFISGVCLPVDGGFHGGVQLGAIDLQAALAEA
ncbi:coniferyl-alcohol dehydrogenase [Novosphingobium pokkalii]|uniref:Coniferyl-alcohol dehydrogenase n=2 Tax=Novosphingobium pokkalii TaxID=1770194 RepID=A0ABV7VA70_9SPHN|nr:coniferyl-alcohol dehydrogenase [Novosphingobium pokkalii]GHD01041.1 3-alpha-hydroxysteroid dehydrogenase [Novosphingobium pokkalii]